MVILFDISVHLLLDLPCADVCASVRYAGAESGEVRSVVEAGRFDPSILITHTFPLARIVEAYSLFGERRDGALKVAIRP